MESSAIERPQVIAKANIISASIDIIVCGSGWRKAYCLLALLQWLAL